MISELKTALNEKTLTIGTERTLKKLRNSEAKVVLLASNCPERTRKDVEHYAKLSNARVVNLDISNADVGIACKKQFYISVLCY